MLSSWMLLELLLLLLLLLTAIHVRYVPMGLLLLVLWLIVTERSVQQTHKATYHNKVEIRHMKAIRFANLQHEIKQLHAY